jgi:hypothetical protein
MIDRGKHGFTRWVVASPDFKGESSLFDEHAQTRFRSQPLGAGILH